MSESTLRIGLVLPDVMGTYGDGGNALILRQRARMRGLDAEIVEITLDDEVPESLDVYTLGGAEDNAQRIATRHLQRYPGLQRAAEAGRPVLAICAAIQVLGHWYETSAGERVAGISMLDLTTSPREARAIGELVTTPVLGGLSQPLSGFENHRGGTLLGPDAAPLAKVTRGVGNGVGVNAYLLRGSASPAGGAADIQTTSRTHQLVTTQTHHALEGTGEARHIVRSGTLAEFKDEPEHPHFAHPVAHHNEDLFPDFVYEGYKWGMVIDQTVCTGCNACVVACQSENNIPIVGKSEVARGREMHWLRVDSYYGGSIDDPTFYAQPMPCQHCEKAPCEPVCPVGATVHDSEGLNVMVYNRCVGTRYCSNNCPFKVRRFNWLQYAELSTTATEMSLANNPDVTVRSRGVMEKCTYCTQRISRARIEAANEDRRIADGEVVTACQAACPTQAIVFGDLNDPTSQVNRVKASPINYTLLDELQVFPRTSYLAKVTNPNPTLVEGHS